MDRHSTLNDSLNQSCQKSKLTSWTKHVNQRGTVYTIRFSETTSILDPNDPDKSDHIQNIIYKPKTQYHVNRDFVRMRGFKNTSPLDRPVDNSTSGDLSYISDIYHSKHDSIVNTQASQPDSNASIPQDSMSCSDASSDAMLHDSAINSASSVKLVHHAPAIQNLSLLEYESVDTIMPLVQYEAAVPVTTHLHDDELCMAHCSNPPRFKPLSEQNVLSENSFSDARSNLSSDSPHCDLLYDPTSDFDVTFESKSILQKETDFCSTIDHDNSPLAGLIYVPDLKDNSISDCSRPPEKCDSIKDQEVPQSILATKDWFMSMYSDMHADFADHIHRSVSEAMDQAMDARFSKYDQSGSTYLGK